MSTDNNDDKYLEDYQRSIELKDGVLGTKVFEIYNEIYGREDQRNEEIFKESERVKNKIIIQKKFDVPTTEQKKIIDKEKETKGENADKKIIFENDKHVYLGFWQKSENENDKKSILFSFGGTKGANVPQLLYTMSYVYPFPYGYGLGDRPYEKSTLRTLKGEWQFKNYLIDTVLVDTKVKATKIDLPNLFPDTFKEFGDESKNENDLAVHTKKGSGESKFKEQKESVKEIYKMEDGKYLCNLTGVEVFEQTKKVKISEDFIRLEWDHRIPKGIRWGASEGWNLQPSVKFINSLKGKICIGCDFDNGENDFGECHNCILGYPENPKNKKIKNNNLQQELKIAFEKLFSKLKRAAKYNSKDKEQDKYFKEVETKLQACINIKKKGECTRKKRTQCPNMCKLS